MSSPMAAAAKRAAIFLLPAFKDGSAARARAVRHAKTLMDEATAQCVRAGRDDLAFQLQAIGSDLAAPPAPRRKRQARKSPGERAKAALRKRGAFSVSI